MSGIKKRTRRTVQATRVDDARHRPGRRDHAVRGGHASTASAHATPRPPQLVQLVVPPAVDDGFSRNERHYLSEISDDERTALLYEMRMNRPQTVPLRFRVARSRLPNKADILHKLSYGCEGSKFDNYVENALLLPFGVVDRPPDAEDMHTFLHNARNVMDEEIYGQQHLKDDTIRALCSWATNPASASFVVGIEGPPGVGKTSFAHALGRIMGRPLCRVAIGGMNDVSVLSGHSYSYESSKYGELARCLIESKSSSPIIVFDEVDKLGDSGKAQEIIALLIHLTDPQSNAEIRDRYFQSHGLSLDFSRACFVFTMNDSRRVSPILLDRLAMVRMETPTLDDKVAIARRFLIPRELRRLRCDVDFDAAAVRELVRRTSATESGVRNLERVVRSVVATLNVARRGAKQTLRTVEVGEVTDKVDTSLLQRILPERSEETGPTHMYC